MKMNAGALKKGDFLNHNGAVYQIVKTEHNMRGRGSANLKFKIKSIANANTVEITCKPDNLLDQVEVESIQMQYLYGDMENCTFMNNQTYEQFDISKEMIGDFVNYMKEGQSIYVILHEGKAIAVRPPVSVTLLVTESENAVKGDTASNAKKYVTLETGAKVLVPLFIKKGENIVVNPESGEYVERG